MNEGIVVEGESVANLPDVEPSKECIRCRRTVLLKDFPMNELTNDGRDQVCTNCVNFHDTTIKLQALSKKRRKTKKGKAVLASIQTTIEPEEKEVVEDFEPIVEDDGQKEEISMDEVDDDAPENSEKVKRKSGFRENLGDEIEQSVYTLDASYYEQGSRDGDMAGKKELQYSPNEIFCVEWVASDGDGVKAYAKGYGKQEKGRKVEKTVNALIKQFDIACRIRYLRDEKAVEDCGFDIAQGKGRWMEEVCRIATDTKLTARDRLKAMELISKAKGHDKGSKSSGGGGTIIRVVTGVRGEPGRNQMKDKKEDKE
jgi:hypothetical protein